MVPDDKIEAYGSLISAVSELDDVERFLRNHKNKDLLDKIRALLHDAHQFVDEFIEEIDPFR